MTDIPWYRSCSCSFSTMRISTSDSSWARLQLTEPKMLAQRMSCWYSSIFAFARRWEWTWWKVDNRDLNKTEHMLPLDGCSVDWLGWSIQEFADATFIGICRFDLPSCYGRSTFNVHRYWSYAMVNDIPPLYWTGLGVVLSFLLRSYVMRSRWLPVVLKTLNWLVESASTILRICIKLSG
jgi:hypothetical protein